MSVALELLPELCEPFPSRPALRAVPDLASPAGGDRPSARPAAVAVLHRPRESEFAAPLRLTRRGVVVLALAAAALAVGVLWLAARSAPAGSAGADARTVPAGTVMTVSPGDTLWSVASRVAPDRDPRAEVAALQRRNHLTGADLTPGQTLRVP